MSLPNRKKAQDEKETRLIDYINWQVFVSLLIPLTSTLILAYNLYGMRGLPQMAGSITVITIVVIVIITMLNIFFSWLTFSDVTLGILGLLIANLIALAIWYKYFPYRYWVGLNLSPITWMVYRIWY